MSAIINPSSKSMIQAINALRYGFILCYFFSRSAACFKIISSEICSDLYFGGSGADCIFIDFELWLDAAAY